MPNKLTGRCLFQVNRRIEITVFAVREETRQKITHRNDIQLAYVTKIGCHRAVHAMPIIESAWYKDGLGPIDGMIFQIEDAPGAEQAELSAVKLWNAESLAARPNN